MEFFKGHTDKSMGYACKEALPEHDDKRVWATFYDRKSMWDLAWEYIDETKKNRFGH